MIYFGSGSPNRRPTTLARRHYCVFLFIFRSGLWCTQRRTTRSGGRIRTDVCPDYEPGLEPNSSHTASPSCSLLYVRILWQFEQTISHLSISCFIFSQPHPLFRSAETLPIFSPRTWSKSMTHGGKLPPQSMQGTDFISSTRKAYSMVRFFL